MEKLEFIAEAKKRGLESSTVQEWLESHDKAVLKGEPFVLELLFDFFDTVNVDICHAMT